MANIGRSWKRVFFVTDSHGNLCHRDRADEAWAIKHDFQPHLTVHLGDTWEFTALRRGASDSELNVDLQADLDAGIEFLERFRPSIVFEGNHCKRIRYLMRKPDGRLAMLAGLVYSRMIEAIEGIGAEWVPFNSKTGQRKIGAHLCMHGYAHGINAIEKQRNVYRMPVIVGDGHKSQMLPGKYGAAPSYMVGALLDFSKVEYDENTLAGVDRSHGILLGEYCEDDSHLTLIASRPGESLRLPCFAHRPQNHESIPYPG